MGRTSSNVLKLRKQTRMKRRYLEVQFSRVHVPRSIGKGHIPEDAQPLFEYRKRGNSVYDAYLNAIFPGVKSKPSSWKSEAPNPNMTYRDGTAIVENVGEQNGRLHALALQEEERLINTIADEDVIDFYLVYEGRISFTRVTFHYNRKKDRCFFVKVCSRTKKAYKSKIYSSEGRAMLNFNAKTIQWDSETDVSNMILVLPRRGNTPG